MLNIQIFARSYIHKHISYLCSPCTYLTYRKGYVDLPRTRLHGHQWAWIPEKEYKTAVLENYFPKEVNYSHGPISARVLFRNTPTPCGYLKPWIHVIFVQSSFVFFKKNVFQLQDGYYNTL